MTSFPIAVMSMISRTLWFGEVRSTENTIEGDHGKSFASAACKPRQPPYLHPGSPLNQRTVLHASKHGRKRRDIAFFYSFNQPIRELRFHLFGFGNTVHNGSHDAKSYFHIWLHIVDALNRTTWFCSCVLSIQISIILI